MRDLVKQPQYYLIACGTKEYPNIGNYEALESVAADIERVVEVLSRFGYKRVLKESLGINPSKNALEINFAKWLLDEERTEADRVIFYYSGHGCSIEGDQHYLLLRDTEENILAQTSLPTNELVKPLINRGVKIDQILYIIDTCYAGQGVAEICSFASEVIDRHQAVYVEKNKSVHLIAASRLKQPAKAGVFSQLFQSELECLLENSDEFVSLQPIQPSLLVDKINQKIGETQRSKQQVGHTKNLCDREVCFFPLYPKKVLNWEARLDAVAKQLLEITNSRKRETLLYVNSFLLMDPLEVDFIFEEAEVLEKLKHLGSLPVSNGICPLVSLSEWLRQKFLIRDYRERLDREIVERISVWQNDILPCRVGIDLEVIKRQIEHKIGEFGHLLSEKQPRLQIEIEPEIDVDNNTGQPTGRYDLYASLWVKDRPIPLARLAQKKLNPLASGDSQQDYVDRLKACLEKDRMLSRIIDNTHLILSPDKSSSLILELEFILPIEYFQVPVDEITCPYTAKLTTLLGKQYPLFINSYGRYFDEDYFRSKESVSTKKERLWKSENHKLIVCYDDDVRFSELGVDIDGFEGDDIFIGSRPAESTLEIIEATFPVAVWSRDDSINLREELDETQWQDWPRRIQELRKKNRNANITLFWDDLYPKPSEKSRPLDPSVVE
jgi:hypothetical protein